LSVKSRELVNFYHIYNSELMEIRYKGIWYKDLAVIPDFLIPYTIVLYKLKCWYYGQTLNNRQYIEKELFILIAILRAKANDIL